MKIDFQHLSVFVLVVLALVGDVVLTVTHNTVPDAVSGVLLGGVGALFGITVPARAGTAAAEDVQP